MYQANLIRQDSNLPLCAGSQEEKKRYVECSHSGYVVHSLLFCSEGMTSWRLDWLSYSNLTHIATPQEVSTIQPPYNHNLIFISVFRLNVL